jgi:iron complex transport system ATP-binding protein
MTIEAKAVSYHIVDKQILHDISLNVQSQEFVGLIGPNGSGKSTLLKNMYRLLQPEHGQIILYDEDIRQQKDKAIAKKMAVVGQESPVLFDFSVRDIVAMGRAPHKKMFALDDKDDVIIIDQALQQAGISHLANRDFSSLSGGEKKRAIIARALTQQAKLLILDEPTNHLDIKHQLQVMDLISSLKLTVLAALHDLNIAATYCDRIYVIKDGRVVTSGTPGEVLTPQLLRKVFDVHAEVTLHPLTQRPSITYLSEKQIKEHLQ